MVEYKVNGDFKRTKKFLIRVQKGNYLKSLEKFAQEGVEALASATPKRTGKTASSWSYEIEQTEEGINIYWSNSNENRGVNIAVILQFGHGTRSGGYVQGRDYINPAIRPIFDEIADAAWKEVTSA